MCSNNFNFANPSSSNAQQSTPPLSTSLPSATLGSSSQPGLMAPLLPNSSSSASVAPLMPADTGSVSTSLTGSATSAATAIAPTTPTSLPPIIAIDQPLNPGTYDITISASPSPTPVTAPTLTLPVSVAPAPPVLQVPEVVPVANVVATPAPPPAPVPIVAVAPILSVPTIPTPAPLSPAPAPAVVAIPEIVQQVLSLTNQFRATNGLAPLNLNIELDAAALVHSQDMAVNQYFSHTGLNGSTAVSRVNQVGYSAIYYGENIAAGYDTAQEVVQGWIDSPEHRANMLNPSFTEIGIGYYYLPNDANSYFSYWTQDFGSGDLNPATYV